MPLYKNVASQKLAIYAHDILADEGKAGDAGNITAQISKDGGATIATDDVNPTELDATDAPGIYLFDLTQAETNANLVIVSPVSATDNIKIETVIVYTSEVMRGTDDAALAATALALTTIIDTIDLQETLTVLLALAVAKQVDKSENTYTFKDQSGATKVTVTYTASSITAVIA